MNAPELTLNGLLEASGIDPGTVLVMRHRPWEPALDKVFDWIVSERRDLFERFQMHHSPRVQAALARAQHVLPCIRHKPGTALFVGLYRKVSQRLITREEQRAHPLHRELVGLGMDESDQPGQSPDLIEFDLADSGWRQDWSQRLVVRWPAPDRAYFRWAGANTFPIHALAEEPLLRGRLPAWDELVLDHAQLALLPASWRAALAQWRGVYLVIDRSDRRQYVGSASGRGNILRRWQDYALTGHGGNTLLKARDPANFSFSILQLVSPAMPKDEVCAIEASWKRRLRTRAPDGLNEN